MPAVRKKTCYPSVRQRRVILEAVEPRRLMSAGDLDFSFSGDGKNVIDVPGVTGEAAHAAVVLADGKTLVAGRASVGGELDFFVARIHASGALDTGFGGGDGFVTIDFQVTDEAMDLALDSASKIVVVGTSSSGAGSDARQFAVARLTSTGVLDTTFSGDGKTTVDFGINADAQAVAIRSGSIYVGGYKDLGASGQFALAKLLDNGNPDTSYSGDGEVFFGFTANADSRAYDIAVDSADRVIMVGYNESVGSATGRDFAYARVGTNALLDDSFSDNGIAVTDFGGDDDEARSIKIDSIGRYVVGGFAPGTGGEDFAATRITSAGALDSTFNGDGRFQLNLGGVEGVDDLVVHPDNDITLSGGTSFGGFQAALVRISGSTGNLSTTFGDGGDGIQLIDFGLIEDTFVVALDPRDLRAVVAGNDGSGRLALARVHDLIDQNYNSPAGGGDLIELADGKLLVFDGFSVEKRSIGGPRDLSFGGGDGSFPKPAADTIWRDFAVDGLGRIVIAGWRNNTSGGSDFLVRRYNADGALDTTFSGDGVTTFRFDFAGESDFATCVAVDAENRIVVGGGAEEGVTFFSDFAVARLTTSGALDSTFSGDGLVTVDLSLTGLGVGDDSIADILVQPDGKILAAGFANVGPLGADDWAFLRLDENGTQDNGFGFLGEARHNVGGGDDSVSAITLDSANRILAVGAEAPDGLGPTRGVIMRLTSSGGPDSTFAGDGVRKFEFVDGERTSEVAVQADGRIVTMGPSGDGSTGTLIRRILSNGSDDPSFAGDGAYAVPGGLQLVGGLVARGGAIFVSGAGTTLRLNVNPAVVDFEFRFETAPQNIRAYFNDDVGAALADSDVIIRNITANSTVGINSYDTQAFDALNNRGTINFNSILADGNYTATFSSTGIENNQLMNLAGDRVKEFFFLNGDANRDRSVNLNDFTILAANFGQVGRVFSQGNFNYSTDGAVNLDDFTILAAQFGKALAAAGSLPDETARGVAAPLPLPAAGVGLLIDRSDKRQIFASLPDDVLR